MKKDGPAPGSYNVEEALRKTRFVEKKTTVGKCKNMSFIDDYAKKHKYSPGVGTYKEIDKAYDKISKSPSLTKKRH